MIGTNSYDIVCSHVGGHQCCETGETGKIGETGETAEKITLGSGDSCKSVSFQNNFSFRHVFNLLFQTLLRFQLKVPMDAAWYDG